MCLFFSLGLAFERLKAAGAPDAQLITFPGLGHDFKFDAVEWGAFLGEARRDPCPKRVLRLCADPHETRAFWIDVEKTDATIREEFTPQVDAKRWAGMDDGEKRRYVAEAADKKTARLEAEMKAPGDFVVKGEGVRSFRLLLCEEMFDAKEAVKVTWNGRLRIRKLAPSKQTVLLDFVERFDRTFLPVAEVQVP